MGPVFYHPMMDFTDRVAIVTGAGKGIGRCLATALAARGAAVVVNNRTRDGHDPAGDTVARIRAARGRAVADLHPVEADGAAEATVASAIEHFGRLDLVVANAAIADRDRFANADPDRFRHVMEVDFFAQVALARAALPHLSASGAGRLLFTSSSAGLYGEFGVSSYAAAKGALTAFARTLAIEHAGRGLAVNVLAPFATTQMTEDVIDEATARTLRPEWVVPAALYLLDPATTANGQVLVAGGNRFRRYFGGESRGIAFPDNAPVDDRDFLDAADALASLDGWKAFDNAYQSFEDLLGSGAGPTPAPEDPNAGRG